MGGVTVPLMHALLYRAVGNITAEYIIGFVLKLSSRVSPEPYLNREYGNSYIDIGQSPNRD